MTTLEFLSKLKVLLASSECAGIWQEFRNQLAHENHPAFTGGVSFSWRRSHIICRAEKIIHDRVGGKVAEQPRVPSRASGRRTGGQRPWGQAWDCHKN